MSKPFIVSKTKWDGLANFAKHNLTEFADDPDYAGTGVDVWTRNMELFANDDNNIGKYNLLYSDGKGSPEGKATAPRGAIAYIASQNDFFRGFIFIKWNNPDASGECPMVQMDGLKKDKPEEAWKKIKGYLGVSATLALSSTGDEYGQAFISTTGGLQELDGFY